MTDITQEHRDRVAQLLELTTEARDILNLGIGRFANILSITDPENPISATLMWQENIIDAHKEEYRAKRAQLLAIIGILPEEIA